MIKNIQEIKVPQIGPNDLSVTIIEWNIDNNEKINEGQHICTIESTKSTFDIESDCEGYIEILYDVGAEVVILQTIAIVGTNISELKNNKMSYLDNNLKEDKTKLNATKKAILKAKELEISLDEIDIKGLHNNIFL